ncbi:YbaK/EbsC family protein, partial [Kitasatospora sp. NPDC054939]
MRRPGRASTWPARYGPIERATAALAREATGQAIGGVAPTGHPSPLRTVVDTALADHPLLWAAAGHPHTVVPMTYPELLGLTGGTEAAVAPSPGGGRRPVAHRGRARRPALR